MPFFAHRDGIFWIGDQPDPWIQLGVNIAGLLAIIIWAAAHSILIFGSLYYFNLLRIDRETEFRGCDIAKHGESAYPVTAWKEIQYSEANLRKSISLPSFMTHNTIQDVNETEDIVNASSISLSQISAKYRAKEATNNGVENVAMDGFEQ